MADNLPDIAELPQFGPRMLALNERQRRFVVALFDEDAPREGHGLWSWAAEQAGYSNSNPNVLKAHGWRIAHDEKVVAAINEYSRLHIRTLSPEAVKALKDLLKNPRHRDHMRAIDAIVSRIDPLESRLAVTVEDNRPPSPEITQKVLDKIEQLMRQARLVSKPAPTIDGECRDVTPGAAQ
jgi:phage terminase small subunit